MYWLISYKDKILLTETEPIVESGLLKFNSDVWEGKLTANDFTKEKTEIKYINTNNVDFIKQIDKNLDNEYK